MIAREWKDRLELPAEFDGELGSDLVGAVGDRRDEAQTRLARAEAGRLALQKGAPALLDQQQRLADAFAQALNVACA